MGIALLILNLGARRWWVVSTTPRPLYPHESPSTHCTGDWVVPRADLDMCKNLAPTWIRSLDHPNRSSVAIPTEIPRPLYNPSTVINLTTVTAKCFVY
jgi:hypothetical protein